MACAVPSRAKRSAVVRLKLQPCYVRRDSIGDQHNIHTSFAGQRSRQRPHIDLIHSNETALRAREQHRNRRSRNRRRDIRRIPHPSRERGQVKLIARGAKSDSAGP